MKKKTKIIIFISILIIVAIGIFSYCNYYYQLTDAINEEEVANTTNNGYTMSLYDNYTYGDKTIQLHIEKDGMLRYFFNKNLLINIRVREISSYESNWTNSKEGYVIFYKIDGTNVGYVFSTGIFPSISRDDQRAIELKENIKYQQAKDSHYPELVAPINPVVAENMYKIENDKVYVSYNKGEDFIEIPVPLTVLVSVEEDHTRYNQLQEGSYVISKEKIAFVYGGTILTPASVVYSDDGGKNWQTTNIQNTLGVTNMPLRVHYISFPTPSHGFVVLANSLDKGREQNFVLETVDGGKTWQQKNSFPTDQIVEFAGFTSETNGLLFGRSVQGDEHTLYQTSDGGTTYKQIPTPKIDGYFLVPLCYEDFKIEEGVISVYAYLQAEGGTDQKQGTFMSKNYGNTWSFIEAESNR